MRDHRPQATPARSAAPRRRLRVVVVVALAAGAAALLVPKPAAAGSYVVRQCTSSAPLAQASWERTSDHYRQRSRCASGGGLQVHHQGSRTPQRRFGAWVWRAPAGTLFASVRANASLTRHSGHRGELWAVPERGPALRFGGQYDAFRVHRRRGEFSRFEAKLRCLRPAGCGRADDDRAHAYVKGVYLRVRDRTAPRVRSATGPLLRGRVVRGSRELSFSATDRGGGVRRVTVAANGSQLGGATRDCDLDGGLTTRLVPCPRSTTETRTIATTRTAFTTGPNVVAVCAEDLALGGRANRDCERRRVWVDNACPASARDASRLSAGFRGGRARTVVRSDRRPILTGRLVDDAGSPVAGATICALTRVQRRGAGVRVARTRRTGADGRYRVGLPAGPSREVFVHHAHGDEVVSRHGLRLRSRVRPTLGVRSPRRPRSGDRLRFRGRLPGPACAGRLVEVQAEIGKRRWQVFRTGRTNRRCRFAVRYRLRATTGPTRYRFRARVRHQPGYPYAGGLSAVRTKRVLG